MRFYGCLRRKELLLSTRQQIGTCLALRLLSQLGPPGTSYPLTPTFVYLCLMCHSLPLLTFCILYGSQRVQDKADAGFPYRLEKGQRG